MKCARHESEMTKEASTGLFVCLKCTKVDSLRNANNVLSIKNAERFLASERDEDDELNGLTDVVSFMEGEENEDD